MTTRTPMEFESIRVDRMPGFPPRPPLSVTGLEPGVNVITGPNMSGKTTLANAMSAVLWAGAADRRAEVTATLRHADARWTLSVEGRALRACQRDGQTSGPPEVPPAELRDRYHIPLVDLLQSDSGPDQFAAKIARETAGGYDLARAAEEVGARDAVPGHRRELAALDEARQVVREQRLQQEELTRQEATLAALEEGRAQAERAGADVPRIEIARELRKATQEEAEAEAELAAFPEAMVKLSGSEEETLRALRAKLGRERDGLGVCRHQGEAAAVDVASIGLSEGEPTSARIQALRSRLQELGTQENRLAQLVEERTRAAARERTALGALGSPPAEDTPRLDPAALTDLEKFAARAERLSGRRRALKSQEALLNAWTEEADADVGRLVRGRSQLVGWLKMPVDGGATLPAPRGPILATAVFAALSSLLLAVLVHWGFLVLLAAGVAASLAALRGRVGPSSTSRDHFEREFLATGLDAPASWTSDAVGDLLVRLEEREAAARLQRQGQVEQARVRSDLAEVDQQLGALAGERSGLLAKYGAAPDAARDLDDAVFAVFARVSTEWQMARMAEAEAAAAVGTVENQIQALTGELAQALAPFGYDPGQRAADIQGALDDLVDRRGRLDRALSEVRTTESKCREHEDRISRLERERADVFIGLCLEDDDGPGLSALLEQQGPFSECRARRQAAEIRRLSAATRLLQIGGAEELADVGDEELVRRLEEARALKDSWEQTVEQITRVQNKITAAGGGTALSDALAAEQAARETMRRCLDRDLDLLSAGLLVDHLREQVRSRSRPPVFQRAAELLAEITGGKCKLDMEDGEPARFTLVETGDPRARTLDELSAGTRLQLLLAVRLADVELQEQGAALPLLMDETLANSDEERALAIVEAVAAMAARGRQVFYFTAQHDEVAKWKAMSAQLGLAAPNVVDLARVQRLDRAREIPLPEAVELVPAPPAPVDGEDYVDYGRRLDVPGLEPRNEGVDGVHVWHLLDDPRVVHALLVRRATTWGRFCVLDEASGGDDGLIARPQRRRMRAAALAIEIASEQWRVGRGKPVTRGVLRASGAISGSFIDAVSELAQACGGDASTLLAKLRDGSVSRFRSDKATQLQEYLEQEGYLDTQPSVPEVDALPRVMGALAKNLEADDITEDRIAEIVASIYGFQDVNPR